MFDRNFQKQYGRHEYPEKSSGIFIGKCKHGCGCWWNDEAPKGQPMAGGPAGLDPRGLCPFNPKDGNRLGDDSDYAYILLERLREALPESVA